MIGFAAAVGVFVVGTILVAIIGVFAMAGRA